MEDMMALTKVKDPKTLMKDLDKKFGGRPTVTDWVQKPHQAPSAAQA